MRAGKNSLMKFRGRVKDRRWVLRAGRNLLVGFREQAGIRRWNSAGGLESADEILRVGKAQLTELCGRVRIPSVGFRWRKRNRRRDTAGRNPPVGFYGQVRIRRWNSAGAGRNLPMEFRGQAGIRRRTSRTGRNPPMEFHGQVRIRRWNSAGAGPADGMKAGTE